MVVLLYLPNNIVFVIPINCLFPIAVIPRCLAKWEGSAEVQKITFNFHKKIKFGYMKNFDEFQTFVCDMLRLIANEIYDRKMEIPKKENEINDAK
jgi:hypothetical protein